MVKMYANTTLITLDPNKRKPNTQVTPNKRSKVKENIMLFPVFPCLNCIAKSVQLSLHLYFLHSHHKIINTQTVWRSTMFKNM